MSGLSDSGNTWAALRPSICGLSATSRVAVSFLLQDTRRLISYQRLSPNTVPFLYVLKVVNDKMKLKLAAQLMLMMMSNYLPPLLLHVEKMKEVLGN